MADYEVSTRITAEGHGAHDRAVDESARKWEQAGRRMSTAGRQAARDTSTSMRQAGDSARRAGDIWQDAAGRWRAASGRFASSAEMAAAGVENVGGASRRAAGGMSAGAAGAARLASNLILIVGAAGAAGAALAALPALASAVGGIGAVVLGAFSGIGAALRGYAADQKAAGAAAGGGASAARSSARAIRDAYKGIADAQRQQARTARDGAEAVEAAARRVVDAKRAEARAYRDAAESILAAQRRYQDTLRDVERAEKSLDAARKDAARTLAELQERVSDLALDQEGAAIAVAEAEKAYQRELASSESTELSRRKALYDLNVAKERQSDLEREAAEAIQENTDAQAKGVEGAENVLDAKERLADAHQSERDALRDLARTEEDAAETRRAATEAVADAERDLARAKRDAAEANEDAARRVADAMERLRDAQEDANQSMGGGAGRASEFAKAMAKLTPEGRAFVYQLLEWKKHLEGLSRTAQRAFLPGLTQMLKDAQVLVPIFNKGIEDTGKVMGDVARQFGDLFKDTGFQKDLAAMFANANLIIKPLGEGLVKLSAAWVRLGANQQLSAAAGRLIEGLFNGLVGLLDTLNENAPVFAEALERWADIFEWLLPLVGDFLVWAAQVDPIVALITAGLIRLLPWVGKLILFQKVKSWLTPATGALDDVGKAADRNKGKLSSFLDVLTGGGGKGGKGGLARTAMKGAGLIGLGVAAYQVTDAVLPESKDFTGPFNNPVSKGARDHIAGFAAGDPAAINMLTSPMQTLGQMGADGILGWLDQLGMKLDTTKNKWGEQGGAVTGFGATMNTNLGGLPAKAGEWFGGLWTSATTWMGQTWTSVTTKAGEILDGIGAWLSRLPAFAAAWFSGMYARAKQWLEQKVALAKEKGRQILDGLQQWLSSLPEKARAAWQGFKDRAAEKITAIVNDARQLPGRILSGLGNLGSLLFNAGVSLISGFWNGLTARWNQLLSWAQSAMASLRAFFPFSPAKEGPFSGSGYVDRSGAALAGDFAASLAAGTPGMIAAARAAMDATRGELGLGTVPVGLPAQAGITAGGPTTVINIQLQVAGTVTSERDLVTFLQEALAKHGDRNTSTGVLGRKQ